MIEKRVEKTALTEIPSGHQHSPEKTLFVWNASLVLSGKVASYGETPHSLVSRIIAAASAAKPHQITQLLID